MPRFFIDIEARLAQFQDALDKITRNTTRSAESMEGAFSRVKNVLGTLGIALSAAAFANAVRGAVTYQSALDDLADTIGGNVRNLDALAREAKISGVAFDQLEGGLTKLAKNLSEADDEGQAAARALQAIGLNVEKIRAQSPDKAFIEVARALDQYQDGANKVAVAQALLGREGARLLPLMKDIAEEGELQGRITAEQAAAAERLEKELRRVKVAFDDVLQAITGALAGPFADWLEANREAVKIAGGVAEAYRLFVFNLEAMTSETPTEQIKRLTGALKELNEQIERRGSPNELQRRMGIGSGSTAELEKQRSDIEKQIKLLRFLEEQQMRRGGRDPNSPLFEFAGGGIKPEAPDLPPDPLQILKQTEDDRQRALRDAAEESAKLAKLIRDQDEVMRDSAAAQAQVQEILDEARSLGVQFLQDQQEKQDKLDEKAAEGSQQFIDAVTAPLVAAAQAEQDRIDGLVFSYDALGRKIEIVREKYDGLKTAQERNADVARQLGFTFSSAFEQAIIEGEKLREVLRGIAQDIARIILRKQVTEPLAAGVAGLDFGKIFGGGGATGGGATLDFSGVFAEGTDFVPRTGLALVHKGERIIPADENRPGFGSVVIQQSNHFHGDFRAAARAEVAMMLPQIAEASRRGVQDAKARGRG